jgi:hypothetical protein
LQSKAIWCYSNWCCSDWSTSISSSFICIWNIIIKVKIIVARCSSFLPLSPIIGTRLDQAIHLGCYCHESLSGTQSHVSLALRGRSGLVQALGKLIFSKGQLVCAQ